MTGSIVLSVNERFTTVTVNVERHLLMNMRYYNMDIVTALIAA